MLKLKTDTFINSYSRNVGLTHIVPVDLTHVDIASGAIIFKLSRNPIFCVYVGQSGSLNIFEIFTGQNSSVPFSGTGAMGVANLHGTTTLSAAISGNDIRVTGIGEWGYGFAISGCAISSYS